MKYTALEKPQAGGGDRRLLYYVTGVTGRGGGVGERNTQAEPSHCHILPGFFCTSLSPPFNTSQLSLVTSMLVISLGFLGGTQNKIRVPFCGF